MSQDQKEDPYLETKKDYIQQCFQLTKFLYQASQSSNDQLKGILLTTLPDIINDEDFQKVDHALRNSFEGLKEDKQMNDQSKFITKQHIECILNMRILNQDSIQLQNYCKNLFQELD
ncbi:hypothetical protein ABPG72_019303 [Tetrahymena utriculariae]